MRISNCSTDTTPATFEDPVNQPHQIPDAASGYSVLCGGHAFLSDGRLLVAGGGGYGPHHLARWGYKFDPVARSWARTAGAMVHDRWYPTVLTLGDQRLGDSHELLVVCGHGAGDMEIYDEATDTFREVSGDIKPFPSLYPGLHVLALRLAHPAEHAHQHLVRRIQRIELPTQLRDPQVDTVCRELGSNQ